MLLILIIRTSYMIEIEACCLLNNIYYVTVQDGIRLFSKYFFCCCFFSERKDKISSSVFVFLIGETYYQIRLFSENSARGENSQIWTSPGIKKYIYFEIKRLTA